MADSKFGHLIRSRRASWGIALLLALLAMLFGVGLARAITPSSLPIADSGQLVIAQAERSVLIDPNGDIDRVAPSFTLGRELYLENCASCHIGVPPGLMPSQVWRNLIRDRDHYGTTIETPRDPSLQIIWNYLKEYSRPAENNEQINYRVGRTTTFKALHPRVQLPDPVQLSTCIRCHPRADFFNFRALSPDWENAP
ncbi:diheme cytochrome C [Limnothrix sp. FACHB-708]|uniref:diheme cytochrome C n=2 Tax=unclassified Limnothrix TaxID=2632864 RepID=UPI0016868FF0|nr:diheme cytochrome C [Limnothrix sp. FACHB-406]MBD2552972.1 diheme cytochrome C [Limnothrix sp. FACHB-708]MBD2589216.1 diheme cytochrome C [Limnothrix sp. FACHB-406]